MSSSLDTIQYICDQAGFGRRLAYRKMFGEFGVYLDGKIIALVCDDQLYLKPTRKGQDYLGKVTLAPPYPGAKDYFLLAAELDDPESLHAVMEITAGALPDPKPKGSRRPKTRAKRKPKG